MKPRPLRPAAQCFRLLFVAEQAQLEYQSGAEACPDVIAQAETGGRRVARREHARVFLAQPLE